MGAFRLLLGSLHYMGLYLQLSVSTARQAEHADVENHISGHGRFDTPPPPSFILSLSLLSLFTSVKRACIYVEAHLFLGEDVLRKDDAICSRAPGERLLKQNARARSRRGSLTLFHSMQMFCFFLPTMQPWGKWGRTFFVL